MLMTLVIAIILKWIEITTPPWKEPPFHLDVEVLTYCTAVLAR
jgi:hypothetical protein